MKRSMSYLIFLSCFIVLTPLYAATQTLTTYYPAPQGNYKNMTVNDVLTLPSFSSCITSGTNVGLANVGGVLQVCDASGTYTLTNTSLWVGSSTFMYPKGYSTENVGIGTNVDPGHILGVTGDEYITPTAATGLGLTIVGPSVGGSPSHALVGLYINGRIQTGDANNVGGVYLDSAHTLLVGQDYNVASGQNDVGLWNDSSGSGTWDLVADPAGNVGIGPGAGTGNATLDINGYLHVNSSAATTTGQGAYLSWNLLTGGTGETDIVNNEGLGSGGFAFMNTPSSGAPKTTQMFIDGSDGVLELFNQSLTGTGNLAGDTIPPVVVCNAARTSCGSLAVAKSASDGNYYAVYGP